MQNDDEIIKKAWLCLKNGEHNALAIIYKKYAQTLLNYGLSIVPDKETVKDNVQELFVTLWNQRANLTLPLSLKAYLVVALKRNILRNLNRENKNSRLYIHYLNGAERFEPDAQNILLNNEQKQRLGKILGHHIGTLTPRQREAIHLRFYEELSYDEIAAIMDLNNQGVRNLIYKAIQSLRNKIPLPQILINFLLV